MNFPIHCTPLRNQKYANIILTGASEASVIAFRLRVLNNADRSAEWTATFKSGKVIVIG